jgi:hypothetical protein
MVSKWVYNIIVRRIRRGRTVFQNNKQSVLKTRIKFKLKKLANKNYIKKWSDFLETLNKFNCPDFDRIAGHKSLNCAVDF